jgi:hypothetical protein
MAGKLLAKRAQQQLKHNNSGKSEASIFMPPPPSAEDMGGVQRQLQGWRSGRLPVWTILCKLDGCESQCN